MCQIVAYWPAAGIVPGEPANIAALVVHKAGFGEAVGVRCVGAARHTVQFVVAKDSGIC